jgi:predicted unusual protein kinase regulating ubiquinone biosynthesis (AarF/ABC1/UbiB family)
MATDPKLRTGRIARGAITGLAVAQAGVAHLGHLVRRKPAPGEVDTRQAEHEAELGRILFGALNQLKGTALKASQLLSMEASLLPEGVRRELARGFHQATPLNRALVHKVFRQEFSRDADDLFQRFDPQAFAAASLGQVHHAELHGGERVVVKVQYPGIAASIGSDMGLIRHLLQGLRLTSDLLPDHDIVDRIMTDIEHRLAEEVDYTHEAGQLQWFGEHARLADVVVPQPVLSHTTRRVLTMQAVGGLHLDAWLATQPGQAARNRAGQCLFDWFMHSVFGCHRLNADPHPGNFLFMPDGQLGVIDFGCTKRLSSAFTDRIARVWCIGLSEVAVGDSTPLRQAYVDLGLISPSLSDADFEQQLMPALAAIRTWQIEPFRQARFDFANRSAFPVLTAAHRQVLTRSLIAVPPELPYFDRAFLGINQLLKTLGAEVATLTPWIHSSFKESHHV